MAELKTRIIIRNDATGEWEAVKNDVVLLKGEMGIEFPEEGTPKIKIGDGTTTWANLDYATQTAEEINASIQEAIKQVDLTTVTNSVQIVDGTVANLTAGKVIGDMGITRTTISGDAKSYTAYVWNGTDWKAMDGNYNASNVYFDKDMMVTTNIGYITTSNGSGTIPSEGKNLEQVFEAMFVKEQNPTKTDPSVSVTLTGAGSYEVGQTVTDVKYTASFADGSYSYGPEPTGAEPTKWEVTSTAGYSYTKNPDAGATTVTTSLTDIALNDVLVLDNTSVTVTAKATHTAGETPKTNKGNDCTDTSKKITAGTKSKTSSSITGYRSYFYGAITVPTSQLTSEIIRDLTNAGNYNGAKSFTIKADGATNLKAFIVAIPNSNTRAGITHVDSTAGMTVDMTESYVLQDKTVSVADYRGTVEGVDTNTVPYKIYAWEPASIDSGAVHVFTLG